MSGPNLWWVYDNESNKFSALPTGPFFVPALIICSIAALFGAGRTEVSTFAKRAGPRALSPEWPAKEKRYWELFRKRCERYPEPLDWDEHLELMRLEQYLEGEY
jgi:hypothetical protein